MGCAPLHPPYSSVIPAEAGIQTGVNLDSRLRRNDKGERRGYAYQDSVFATMKRMKQMSLRGAKATKQSKGGGSVRCRGVPWNALTPERLLRGVYPERDSLVALLTQNDERRRARNDTRNPDFEVDRSFRGRSHA